MYLAPPEAIKKSQAAKEEVPTAPKRVVEIYRGLQKEVVPLSR